MANITSPLLTLHSSGLNLGSGNLGLGTTSPTAPLDVFGVRAGRDWHIANRAGIRLDANGTGYPSDLLFGHTAAANQTSWTGAYWSLSSRGTTSTISNSFYFYRGGGHPSPYNSEAVLMTFTPDLKVGINTTDPKRTLDLTAAGQITFGDGVTGNYNQGIYWNSGGGYGIYRTSGTWSSPDYQQLQINFDTGIILNPGSGNYGKSHVGVQGGLSVGDSYYTTMEDNGLIVQGSVGIGNASPTRDLHIGTTASTSTATPKVMSLGGTYSNSAGSNPKLEVWGNGTDYMGFGVSSNTLEYLLSKTTYKHVFYAAGSPLMTILGTGNVGIGTTSPTYHLHVRGSGIQRMLVESTDNQAGIGLTSDSADQVVIYSPDGSADLSFYLSSNDRVRFKNDGNVGIGITNPSTLLEIASGGELKFRHGAYAQPGAFNTASNGDKIILYNDTTSYDGRIGVGTASNLWFKSYGETSNEGIIDFYTGGHHSVRINGDGAVGIGTTSVTSGVMLDVRGDILISGSSHQALKITAGTSSDAQIHFGDSDDDDIGMINYDNAQDAMKFIVNTAERMRITSAGELQVTGNGVIRNQESGGNFSYLQQTSSDARLFVQYSQPLLFGTVATERMRIAAGGNVGIGTTNPTSLLHLRDSSTDADVGIKIGNDVRDWNLKVMGSVSDSFQIFTHDDSNVFTILSDGNVGINTTSPDAHLHVEKSSGTTTVLTEVGGNSIVGYEIKKTGSTTQHWKIVDGATINGKLEFYDATDSATRMTIDGNGNIGIGTTSPSSKLHVVGTTFLNTDSVQIGASGSVHYVETGSANLLVRGTSGSGRGLIEVHDGSSTVKGILQSVNSGGTSTTFVGTLSNHDFRLITNSAEKVRILPNGNVGIGTTSPSAILHLSDSDDQKIILSGSGNPYIRFQSTTTNRAYIQWIENGTILGFFNQAGDNFDFFTHDIGGATNLRLKGSDGDIWGSVYADENGGSHTIGFLDGDQNWALRHIKDTSWDFRINNGTYMHINSSGSVGIGTTSPARKLHIVDGTPTSVASPLGDAALVIDGDTHQYINMRTTGASSGYMQGITFTDNGHNAFIGYKEYTGAVANTYGEAIHIAQYPYTSDPNCGIYLGTSTTPYNGVTTPQLFVKANGNVGIGTGSPGRSLSIYKASSPVLQLINSTTGSLDSDGFLLTQSGSDSYLENAEAGAMIFRTSATDRMIISSSGYTSIGSNSPGTTRLRVVNGSSGQEIFKADDGSTAVIRAKVDGTVTFEKGNVGIGQTSPVTKLHIAVNNSSVHAPTAYTNNGVKALTLRTQEGDGLEWHLAHSTNGYTGWVAAARVNNTGGNWGNGYLEFTTASSSSGAGNANVLVLTGTGNVGIGTASTSYKLHVNGPIYTTNYYAVTTASSYQKLSVYGDGSTYGIGMVSGISYGALGDWAMTFRFNSDDDRGFWWGDTSHNGTQGAMSLTTNGLLTVANKISVGYGEATTSGPSYRLDISEYLTSPPSEPTVRILRSNNIASAGQTADNPELLIKGHSSNYKLVLRDHSDNNLLTVAGDGSTNIASTTSGASVLTVDGTNGTLFSVVDDLSDSLMSVNDAAGLPVLEVFADSHVVAGRYGQNDFYLDTNGNLGLGTASPSTAKLDVRGRQYNLYTGADATILHLHNDSATGYGAYIRVDNYDVSRYALRIDNGTGQNFTVPNSGGLIIANLTDNVDQVRITRAGYSTTHADAKLYIYDNSDADWAQKISLDGYGYGLRIDGFDTHGLNLVHNTLGQVFVTTANQVVVNEDGQDCDFRVESDTNDHMLFVDAATNEVGIGISTPAATLDVIRGNTTNGGTAQFRGTTYSSHFNYATDERTYIRGGKSGAYVTINDSHNGQVHLANGGGSVGIGTTSPSQKLHVFGNTYISGNLGIGTSSPTGNLHIQKSAAGALFESSGSTNYTGITYLGDTSNNFWSSSLILNNANGIFEIRNNSSSAAIAINTSGNVGINTTSPTAKLHVNGTVTTGNLTADYVTAMNGIASYGNVTATAFYGDGSNLTNIPTSSYSWIVNADSSSSNGTVSNLHYVDFSGGCNINTSHSCSANPATHTVTIAYNVSSDYRLKECVNRYESGYDVIKSVPTYSYNYNACYNAKPTDQTHCRVGMMAHELQAGGQSQGVTGNKDEVDENNKPIYQKVHYDELVPTLWSAVRTLIEKVEKLEGMSEELIELKNKINLLG